MVLYILIKSFAILAGKNKIDKTRALFLYYNKYQVIMAKMTTATCDFLLAFLCLLFCGNIIA